MDFHHERLEFFNDFPQDQWEYVSLQNIQSINAHKDDVLADPIMLSSSIICLTETSLKNDIWFSSKSFDSFELLVPWSTTYTKKTRRRMRHALM
jgi:hypothetical protein